VSEWHIDVNLKNGDTIAIACASERDLQETRTRRPAACRPGKGVYPSHETVIVAPTAR
jgi:hypothetical protein